MDVLPLTLETPSSAAQTLSEVLPDGRLMWEDAKAVGMKNETVKDADIKDRFDPAR